MPIEKSAGAIVFRQEKKKIYYLLLHYPAGHWGFPKGNIEKGEKLKKTAKREIKEETGIEEIEFIPKFKESIKYFYKLKGKNIFKIAIFFLVKTKEKEIKISWEHLGYQWLPYEKTLERLIYKNAREILEKANDFLVKHD